MFIKNKTFLSKSKYFLLATSSIGLLASTEALAVVDITPNAPGYSEISNYWKSNGRNYLPQDDDNIILTANDQQINFDRDINIGNINLYGFTSDGLVILANGPTRQVSINNIVNFNDQQARTAVQNALGVPLAYGGDNNSKVQIRLQFQELKGITNDSNLTITGNDISAVDSIVMEGKSAKLIFAKPITVEASIYARTNKAGIIEAKDDVIFEKVIGHHGEDDHSVALIMVGNNKSITLKSDIYATGIVLKKDSKLIIDSAKQNINVHSGVAIKGLGIIDGDGIIQAKGSTKNIITFFNDIGAANTRVGEINIGRGKGAIFDKPVYAKSIKVANNPNVEFKEKLDMQHRNGTVIDTGNLEFTNYGNVKFHKDFAGDITTSVPNQGGVTFVNTPDIYGIGSKYKKIEKLTFEGNHIHNLHENIHALQVDFDGGTYNIATKDVTINEKINGKANGKTNINGSTLNLTGYNLTLQGKVNLSNNINVSVTGKNKVIFETHTPSINDAGANIIITIDGAQPADERTALAVFRVNAGAFPPLGYHYAGGILALPGLGGAMLAEPAGEAVAAPVLGGVGAAAPALGGEGVPAEGIAAGGEEVVEEPEAGVGVPPPLLPLGRDVPIRELAPEGGVAPEHAPAERLPVVVGEPVEGAVAGGEAVVGEPGAGVGVPPPLLPLEEILAGGALELALAPEGGVAPPPAGVPVPGGAVAPAVVGGAAAPVAPAPGGAAAPAPAGAPPAVVGVPAGGGAAAPVAPAPGGVAAPAPAGAPPAGGGVPAGGAAAPVVPAPGGVAPAPAAPVVSLSITHKSFSLQY